MSHRSNAFRHYQITVDGGDTYTDRCRDSFGGYVNLVRRVAEHIDPAGLGSVVTLTAANGSESAAWRDERTGTTGRIEEVTR